MTDEAERWRGEVTQSLHDISRRLDEMAERFEKALQQHVEKDDTTFEKHDGRLSVLEKASSSISGKMFLVGSVGAVLLGAAAQAVLDRLLR
jgi:hypothetical protein